MSCFHAAFKLLLRLGNSQVVGEQLVGGYGCLAGGGGTKAHCAAAVQLRGQGSASFREQPVCVPCGYDRGCTCILFIICAFILLVSALLWEAASICIGSAERLKEIVTDRKE